MHLIAIFASATATTSQAADGGPDWAKWTFFVAVAAVAAPVIIYWLSGRRRVKVYPRVEVPDKNPMVIFHLHNKSRFRAVLLKEVAVKWRDRHASEDAPSKSLATSMLKGDWPIEIGAGGDWTFRLRMPVDTVDKVTKLSNGEFWLSVEATNGQTWRVPGRKIRPALEDLQQRRRTQKE